MGAITSSVGLVSGINTGAIINALIAADSGPVQTLTTENTNLTNTQVAYQTINAQLLALKLDAQNLTQTSTFNANTTTSSNPNALTATADATAAPGTYDFTVGRLVSTQQVVTNGFADQNSTPVGAGTLTFDFGNAGLGADTSLSQLNGGAGVARGQVRITDGLGASALVDLSQALTIGDVVNDINSASGINVTASVNGDSLQVKDNTGLSTAALSVANVGGTNTATSLGLTVASSGGVISGSQINSVGASTLLSSLNDGNGVQTLAGQNDIHIATRDGTGFDVGLSNAATLGQVISDINAASAGKVTASINSSGTGLALVDNSTPGGGTFAVTADNGSQAAADLGILATDTGNTGAITGGRVIAALDSTLVKSLNGGSGANLGEISITNRAGAATQVNLAGDQSVSDIINSINNAGAGVTAALNSAGDGIQLTDTTGSTASNLIVSDVTGTGAADLGIAGSAAADTINSGDLHHQYIAASTELSSLNGGAGVALGSFTITDSKGNSANVTLSSNATTIQDVLNDINTRGLAINATVNSQGNGIIIQDTGNGGGTIKVVDDTSTTAADLGIAGTASAPNTALDGSFEKTVAISSTDTLQDVVNNINDAGINVQASVINDGSANNPFRLSIQATKSGSAGAFTFDDGGLNLGGQTLVQAQNAVVFYGSANAAQAVAVTSATNTLTSVVPGATISLVGTSTGPVQLNISRDNSSVVNAVQQFATDFNTVVNTISQYDSYDASTNTAGLLLGDPTVENVLNSLFNIINGNDAQVAGQYQSLADLGITVNSDSSLSLNTTQLTSALAQNPGAVTNLFTLNTTSTDSTGKTVTTAAGVGTQLNQLLASITDPTSGAIQDQLNNISSQITLNTNSITDQNTQLAAQRALLQEQFNNMELTLSQLQSQGAGLSSLTNLFSNVSSSSTTNPASVSGSVGSTTSS